MADDSIWAEFAETIRVLNRAII